MADRTFQIVLLVAVVVIEALALVALWRGSGTRHHRIVWTLVILLLPVIGVTSYIVWGHGSRDAHLPP